MGTSCGRISVDTVICCVLSWSLLSGFCADAASLGFRSEGTRLGAHRGGHDDMQLEHWMGKNLLSQRALPLESLELDDLTLENATVEAQYKSNSELEAALRDFTQRCSQISRLYRFSFSTHTRLKQEKRYDEYWNEHDRTQRQENAAVSIGNSTLGVPLWVVEISDKPGKSEPEPSFKYVGNMHGDEPLGRELVLLLGEWLCENYMKDPLATLIVNKVHLHLLPSMNPDGFAAMPHPTRNNPHDVDLNRDFPDQFFPHNNDEEKRQAETRAIMGWIRSTRFTASASFHEGALVANYPYDGTHDTSTRYAVSPDDSTFKFLAGLYAQNHPLMIKSKEFVGGITNGAAWYPLYGGMQDWNYLHGNCLELTLEMNEDKWPPISKLSKIWSEHRKSMLELVAATVTSGVHGRVMSSASAQPLAATISVTGVNQPMTASAEFGDYHRLLAPGKVYEVTASMVGYDSRTTSIFLPGNSSVTLDFILDPLPSDAEELGRARLRGQGHLDKNGTFRKVPPAPQQTASGRMVIDAQPESKEVSAQQILQPDEQKQPLEMVSWKPTKYTRKGLRVDALHDGSANVLRMQLVLTLLPLVAVAAALVCLLYGARGGPRYQTWRQRVFR